MPEGRYSAVEGLVPGCTEEVVVNVDVARVSFLVQDRVNGRGGVQRGDVGDHDVLNVVIEEEPRFLPAERLCEWVEVSHGCDACFVVRHATNERLKSRLLCIRAVKRCGSVVGRGAWDEVPIPCCRYVLVFVALQVRIKRPVGEVETEWLARKSQGYVCVIDK